MKTTKEPKMTTSSFKTNNSLLIAAALTAVVRVIQPVLETRLFPGRASIKALAFTLGSAAAGVEDEYRRLLSEGRLVFDESNGGGREGRESIYVEGTASLGDTLRADLDNLRVDNILVT